MNYRQAQNILDEVREGANYSIQTINKALELTGDLMESGSTERLRSPRVDQAIQKESQRPGGLRCPSVVAKDVIRNSADSWAISR